MGRMGPARVEENAALAGAPGWHAFVARWGARTRCMRLMAAKAWHSRGLRRFLLLALAVALVGLYAGRNQVLPAAARFLDVSEPVEATDFVMVLGGDLNSRPFVAAALLDVGLARKALMVTING